MRRPIAAGMLALAALAPFAAAAAPSAPATRAPQAMTAEETRAMAQIMARLKLLGSEMRTENPQEYARLLASDYTEFDPYYPFLLAVPRGDIVRLQQVWDKYEKVRPAPRADKTVRLQLYGDVAIITTTSYFKGQAIPAGPLAAHKSVIVYVRQDGEWVLSHCHDGRVAGADGLPVE
jgi:hypothetical protein